MDILEIFFDPTQSNFDQLLISLDRQTVDYKIINDTIQIQTAIDFGIHLLRVQMKGARFEILDVKLNHVSLRASLYLSWIQFKEQDIQPATCLWEPDQIWILPFGNPISNWLTQVDTKIGGLKLGSDLMSQYHMFYPEPYLIENHYPALLKDFFKYDFDFTMIPRGDFKRLPYHVAKLSIPENLIVNAHNEVDCNYSEIVQTQSVTRQGKYNKNDDPDFDSESWTTTWFMKKGAWCLDMQQFPHIKNLIESLELNDIRSVFVAITKPNSYISPHVDNMTIYDVESEPYLGCTQFYITLTDSDQSLFKIGNVGVIPNKPVILNNQYYMHAVVNNQDKQRITVGIRFNLEKNLHLFE